MEEWNESSSKGTMVLTNNEGVGDTPEALLCSGDLGRAAEEDERRLLIVPSLNCFRLTEDEERFSREGRTRCQRTTNSGEQLMKEKMLLLLS